MTLTGAKSQIKSQKRIVSSKIEATERLKKVREGLLELKTMLSEIDPEEDD